MLEGSQFRALTADGANSALRLLDQHGGDIKVLLTELRMSDGDGIALARRAVHRNPELRVVYMSGVVASDSEVAAVAASGAPFVRKPFTVGELSGAIATARSLLAE